MAKKRRSSRKRSNRPSGSGQKLPKAAQVIGFTDEDEAFFRAGDSTEHLETIATVDDANEERPGFWRRLFARSARTQTA